MFSLKNIALTLLLAFAALQANAQQWLTGLDEAMAVAKNEDKNIILLFERGPKCDLCIKLRALLQSEVFIEEAKEHWILAEAGANPALFEKYNNEGIFPLVVVLDNTGKVLGKTPYKNVSPELYIMQLRSFEKNAAITATAQGPVAAQRTLMLMGSRFDITMVAATAKEAEDYIDQAVAEITRIENVISEWRTETEVSAVNRNAGIAPVKVSKELFDLTERALYFSKISNGAFDISFAAMDRIWKFDGSMEQMPTDEAVKKSVAKVGYKNIILDKANSTIFLKLDGMKIGFGSIGKGYAADKAREVMMAMGVKAGIINASGDMNTWGTQPDGKPWTVGITNPIDKNKVFAVLPLHNSAVVTSGSYEKYVLLNGKRYSHIINPVTGYPATGLSSVTVMGPSAETANGFSTAIMVLGKKAGLKLINRFDNLSCIIVTDEGEIIASDNIDLKKYTQ